MLGLLFDDWVETKLSNILIRGTGMDKATRGHDDIITCGEGNHIDYSLCKTSGPAHSQKKLNSDIGGVL